MVKGVSPLRLFSRVSPKKTAQDVSPANGPATGTGARAPLSSIPEAAFNPVLGDANSGHFSSPPRKADPSTPQRKKSSALGQGGAYPHLENSDVSCTPPTSGIPQGVAKSQYTWHQRQHSSNAPEAVSEAQGSSSAQPASAKSVSRALKYSTHLYAPPGSGASGSGRSQPLQNAVARTPSLPKCAPPHPSATSNTDQQFDLEEDPTFWRDHNVQVLIRTRPLSSSEIAAQGFARCVRQDSGHMITWMGQPESRFTFDHVACESITQEKLFRVAGLPMVDNCIAGYNSCMFAYGQTGSGKTHTMLGDVDDLDCRPSSNRGMTPRVFEYLFARIRHEEESRRHEHLKYHCKCSFLEIYNEQITDLLEPTSNNLQMREDSKKGVYVENLTEVEVLGVQDVIQLLLQGAANRKVAATNMNRESSRSHSVFTCVVESKWEYDSMMNTRFGRLNLVDLAGSERQKNSGAEGERLKEAANINKSLSTLGLVIMVLVDIANGKQRHVPYRDSKLTFLLQDSLGGNSKTTIIANVSPSSCCSMETLSTLKFAQRAKFIRNNAVVNEDASADVVALREQIRQLQDEVSRLRRQGTSRSASFRSSLPLRDVQVLDDTSMAIVGFHGEGDALRRSVDSSWDATRLRTVSTEKAKRVEALLAGALRREQDAENSSKRLAAEIEQLNRLVRQREEDTQCTKMMLRFREDKIRRLEGVADGILSAEECLMEEKAALQEELQAVRARIDRNPELTRFAMENIRLMEDVRRYQEFYEGMEREILMQEIGSLRDKLIEVFDGKVPDEALLTPTTSQKGIAASDAVSMRHAEEIMQLQLQLESYEAVVEEKDRQRHVLEAKNFELNQQVDQLKENLDKVVKDFPLNPSATICKVCSSERDQTKVKVEDQETAPSTVVDPIKEEGMSVGENSTSRTAPLRESRAPDIAASMRHAEEIMQLQLQLESYEAMLEEGQTQRQELEAKCADLTQQVDQLTHRLGDTHGADPLEQASGSSTAFPDVSSGIEKNGEAGHRRWEAASLDSHEKKERAVSYREDKVTQPEFMCPMSSEETTELQLRLQSCEALLDEEQNRRQELAVECKNLNEQVDELTEKLKYQVDRERQMDVTRAQAETETAQTIKLLHSEVMELKNGTASTVDSPGAHTMSELMNDLETRAIFEAAAEVDDMIESSFSVRLSIDNTFPRGSVRAADRSKSLEVIQRKLQTAHALARETEAQFQTLSSSVMEMNDSHHQETEDLKEQIRRSHERRAELEDQTSALAGDLENLRQAVKAHEESVYALERKWKREKDQLLLDVHEARMAAKEKGSEAATLQKRFEESQSILVELEQTMNALVRANETKSESEREWRTEKDRLWSQLQEARLMAEEKDSEVADMRKKFEDCQISLRELHVRTSALVSSNELLQSDAESWHAEKGRLCLVEQLFAVLEANLQKTQEDKKDLELQVVELQQTASEFKLKSEDAQKLGAAIDDLEAQLQARCVEIREMEATICNLREALENKEDQLNSVSCELLERKAEVDELQRHKESVESQLEGKRKSMETLETVHAMSVKKAKSDSTEEWRQEKAVLLSDLKQAKIMAKEKEAEAVGLRQVVVDGQASLKDLMQSKEAMLNLQSDEVRQVKEEIKELRLEKKALEGKLEEKQQSIAVLKDELLQVRSLEQSRSESEKGWRRETDSLISELEEARLMSKKNGSDAARLRNSLEELQATLCEKENLVNSLSDDLLQLNEQVQELQMERRSMHSQLDEQQQLIAALEVEVLDATALKNVISLQSDELQQRIEQIEELRMKNKVIEGKLEEKEECIAALEQDLVQAASLEHFRSVAEIEWTREKDGLLTDLQEARLVGDKNVSEVAGLRTTLRELEEVVSEKENLVNSLSEDLLELNAQVQELHKDKQSTQAQLRELEEVVSEKENLVNSLSEDLLQLNAQVQELHKDKQSTQAQLDEKQQLIATLETELLNATGLERARSESEGNWDRERDRLLSNLQEVMAMVKEKDAEVLNLHREFSDAQARTRHLEVSVSEKEQIVCLLSDELLQSKAEVQQMRKENEVVQDQLVEQRKSIETLEAEVLLAISTNEASREAEKEWNRERGLLVSDLQQRQLLGDESASEAGNLRKQLSELNSALSDKEEQISLLLDDQMHLKSKIEGLQLDTQATDHQLEEKRIERDELLSDLQEANLRVKVKEAEAASLQNSLSELEAAVYAKDNLLNSLSDELLQSTAEIQDLHSTLGRIRDQLKEKDYAIANLEEDLVHERSLEQTRSVSEEELKREREALISHLQSATLMAKAKELEARSLRQTFEDSQASSRDLERKMGELVVVNQELISRAESCRAEKQRLDLVEQECAILQAKLKRTEDVKQGLEFDISLLQESTAELKVKREEAERLGAAVEHLEHQLEIRCEEIVEMRAAMCKLETAVYDKEKVLNTLSDELLEAKGEIQVLRRQKDSLEVELDEKQHSVAALEIELLDATSLEQDTARSLKKELNYAIKERDRLHAELVVLTEQLDMAQAIAEEQETLACEARQVAETSKTLAEQKDAEARLLERSVDELESTVNALESQVGIVKREGERQRLLREDLEMELQSLKHHMSTVQANAEEKETFLLQARKTSTLLVPSNKSAEKPKTKSSTSPFKCGSKGLVQQMHLDIDEEIYTNRQRIEELEGIAAARQKEVFMLHTRLAEAESMTHDVLRDMLGVKLDITNCASLLSQEKVQQIAEAARKRTDEAKEKEAELSSVRAQLTEFIEERESWLEEINRRQAEMVAARVAAEKLRLRDQTLTSENERLQRETNSQRRRVQELEAEVKKLSGQQNLQQRIHHHAKIKEENNLLRTQNEDLGSRLRRTEMVLARVSEELARYRTAEGKTPFLNIDEENRLKNRLKEEEDNRIQIAQKFISICTAVMKAAGVGQTSPEVDPEVAFRAVHQLDERLKSAERELSDMKLQTRIAGEKRRLSELRAVNSPFRTNFTAGIQVSSPRGDR